MSSGKSSAQIGQLDRTVVDDSLLEKTFVFIKSNLSSWRDDNDREKADAEEDLNAQLANFLQAKATHFFPMIQFQHEQRQTSRRRIDLSVKPTVPVIVCGTYLTIYSPLTVIEGKRLPAPSKKRAREYVSGGEEISGGIQRFKLGLHGKDHDEVVIVGYIQDGKCQDWFDTVNLWIAEFITEASNAGWTNSDKLSSFSEDSDKVSEARSHHERVKDCKSPNVSVRHYWVKLE